MNRLPDWKLNELPRPATWLTVLIGTQVAALGLDFSKIGLTSETGNDSGRVLAILPGQMILGTFLLLISPNVLKLLKRPEAAGMAIWMMWGLFTLFWSVDPRQTTILSIGAMNLFVIALWLTYYFGISAFIEITSTTVTLMAIGGVYWQWFTEDGEGFNVRFEGLATGFNPQAAVCSFGIIFAMIGIKVSDRFHRLRWFSIIALLVGLVLTGGRTSLAAVVAVAGAVLFRRELFDIRYRRYIIPTIGAVGISIATVLATANVYQRTEDNTALNGRDLVWSHSLDLTLESPLFGHGMMAGGAIWQAAENLGLVDFPAGGAHNTILEILVGGGIIGLALFIGAIGLLLRSLVATRSETGVALVVIVLLSGLTESMIHRPTIAYWALGAAAAVAMRAKDEQGRTKTEFRPILTPEAVPLVGKAKVGRFG